MHSAMGMTWVASATKAMDVRHNPGTLQAVLMHLEIYQNVIAGARAYFESLHLRSYWALVVPLAWDALGRHRSTIAD